MAQPSGSPAGGTSTQLLPSVCDSDAGSRRHRQGQSLVPRTQSGGYFFRSSAWARRSESDPLAAQKVIHLGACMAGLRGCPAPRFAEGMLRVDQVHVVRHKVLVEGRSQRQVARELGLSRLTVRKYVAEAVPVRKVPVPRARPVWAQVGPRVEALLAESGRWTGGKQQLTATRLHELLVGEGIASPSPS